MAYEPTHPLGWQDLPDTSTPVLAEHLNHIEQGIADADAKAESRVASVNAEVGDEARPVTTGLVIWLCGPEVSGTPTNALPGDLVFSSSGSDGTAPIITTASLPSMTQDTAFTVTLAATGTAPITWAVTTGTLPAGLTLNASTGTISGTPSGTGAYSFTVTATNSLGSNPQAYSGTVAASGTAPTITTTSIAAMTVGSVYSQVLAASGSTPITWGVTAGTLPAGVGINSSTGALSGTPTTAGSFSFTVTATNAFGSDPQAYSGTVAAASGGAEHSIFTGAGAPFALTRNTDGTPNIEMATGFYGPIAGWQLTKVRLFIPAGTAPSSVAIRVYHPAVNGSPTLGSDVVTTGTITSPVAGAWNEAVLAAPVTLANNRVFWVSYDAGAGVYYTASEALPSSAYYTAHDGSFYLADRDPYGGGSSARRNFFRIGTGGTTSSGVGQQTMWYGLDVVVVAP